MVDTKPDFLDIVSAMLEPPEAPPFPGTTEAPPARARYTVRTAADALQPQPPIEFLVDKWVTAGSLIVLYGDPGDGKTYALISLATCVSNGLTWLDFTTKQSPVLIIDEESGENRLSRRLSEALRGEGCDATSPLYYVSLAGFRMDDKDKKDPALLQALIERTGAKLVILDALADFMGGDENSKEDTLPIFTELRKIADRTGAAIILIHHANKAGGYRGSSAIAGAVDVLVKITKDDNILTFQTEKNRDGDPLKWQALATWLEKEGTFTLRPWETIRESKVSDKALDVLEYFEENGDQPFTALQAYFDRIGKTTLYKHIDYWVKEERILRKNPKAPKGTPAIYGPVKRLP